MRVSTSNVSTHTFDQADTVVFVEVGSIHCPVAPVGFEVVGVVAGGFRGGESGDGAVAAVVAVMGVVDTPGVLSGLFDLGHDDLLRLAVERLMTGMRSPSRGRKSIKRQAVGTAAAGHQERPVMPTSGS